MAEDLFSPSAESHSPRVYVGAHVPLMLYTLLVEEAERAMVTRSDVIRWALADRYRKQGTGGEVQEPSREQQP
jgi:hypothetical protein